MNVEPTVLRSAAGAAVVRVHAGCGARPVPPADAPVVLSRFAVLRAEHGRLVLDAPRTGARVELCDSGAAAVVAALAEPGPAERAVAGWAPAEVGALVRVLAAAGIVVAAGEEDADPVLAVREPHDVWFHAASRRGTAPGPMGATWPGRRHGAPPPAVPDRDVADWCGLPEPDAAGSAARADLFALLARRRTRRRFGPLTAGDLGLLLGSTLRIGGRHTDEHGWETTRRPVPSGGACHDLEAYVAAGAVDGIPAGLWWYDAGAHRLGRLPAPAGVVARALVDAAGAMGGAGPPPAVVVLASRFGRTAWKYQGIAYALTLKHVGVVMGTMALVGEAGGLTVCPLGTGDTPWFAAATGLDPLVESAVGELAVGGPTGRG